MSKTIKIELDYLGDNNKEKTIALSISRVNNWAAEAYDKIKDIMDEVQDKSIEAFELEKEIDVVVHEMGEDWFLKRKTMKKEVKQLKEEIKRIGKSSFFKDRFELISGILKDNNIKDEFLHSYNFWNDKVEPPMMINIMTQMVYKDAVPEAPNKEGKKKPRKK